MSAAFRSSGEGLVYLIIGGTGTFGRAAVRALLARRDVRKVRVMSRDEAKHASLKAEFREASESKRLSIENDVLNGHLWPCND